MTETQEVPAEIMAEARAVWNSMPVSHIELVRDQIITIVSRSLLARDTAARKECAEIIERVVPYSDPDAAYDLRDIITAIEATITGG